TLSKKQSFSISSSSSQGAYNCIIRTFTGTIFTLIIIILSEIGSHIIIDFTTSSFTIIPTPFLFFTPPEQNTLYLSPPSLSGSCVKKDPSLSQHVSDT